MVYNSMVAWGRHAFELPDEIHTQYTSPRELDSNPVELAMPMACSGVKFRGGLPIDCAMKGSPLAANDRLPLSPNSPTALPNDAPSFSQAKSQWSPPHSPRTLSLKCLRSVSRQKDSSKAGDPPLLSPKDGNALADKLYAASCAGDIKHIRLLLSLGAPINTPSLVQGLYDSFKPAKPGTLSALAGAAGHGNIGAVKILLANGAALNPTMKQSSSSPLLQACKADDVEMAHFLLESGADVDMLNCFNTTPLMYASKYGSAPLVALILSYNPDLHRLSFIKSAAIHWTLWRGNEDVVELVLQAGANPDHAMGDGSTPLHRSAISELPEVAMVLLKYGADPLKRDEEWKTPLQVAVEMGHWETAGVLREAEKGVGER